MKRESNMEDFYKLGKLAGKKAFLNCGGTPWAEKASDRKKLEGEERQDFIDGYNDALDEAEIGFNEQE